MTKTPEPKLSEAEIAKRRDAGLRNLLKMPPKPHAEVVGERRPDNKSGAVPPGYLVIDGKIRVAGTIRKNADGSITADVFRNLEDFRAGQAMERAARFMA